MAGPILTFLDNLQERQPVRNALRGVLGLPRRRSTLIDPMEEMTARDAEMGGDISNPFPNTRMAPRIASTATTGPGVAAALPAPSQPAVDETQPYKGMGMAQAIVTPPSAALRQRRAGMAAPAAGGGRVAQAAPNSLSQSIGLISQNTTLPASDRALMLSDLMTQHAAEATDNDRRATLVRLAETYLKQHATLSAIERGERGFEAARAAAEKMAQRASDDAQKARTLEEKLPGLTADAQIRVNSALTQSAKDAASTPTQFNDYTAPLNDMGLTITDYANRMRGAVEMAMFNGDKPFDPALAQAEYDRAFEAGFVKRLAQIGKNSSDAASMFGRHHPAFGEIESYYRGVLAKNPAQYDALANRIAGQIASSAGREMQLQGYASDAILRYSQKVAADILGPKPETPSIFSYFLGK